ncbi:MAG: HAMP domain-containing sensor histidine kinase [Saprospiraceae bacterium]
MEIYKKTERWKIYLIAFGIIILILPIYYANRLAQNLAYREKVNVQLFIRTLEELSNDSNLDEDVSYETDMQIKLAENIHVVTINRNDVYQFWNYGEHPDSNSILKRLEKSTNFIETNDYPKIYYEYPFIVTLIRYFPWLQLFLLLIYAAIGYAVFNLSKKEEQNRVWVGMAKETAHQLGTPISGLMGWIEQLKSKEHNTFSSDELVQYLEQDVEKLQQISDRFSKIGSNALLNKESLLQVLLEAENYIKPRASKKIVFDFPQTNDQDYYVLLNKNLFSWVLENILRNALDAMTETGKISARIYKDKNRVCLDISDTGKGINANNFHHIFRPGFTTKERGWGLGLSLAKRIVENYHDGKIFVKESVPNQKTTFTIQLIEVV